MRRRAVMAKAALVPVLLTLVLAAACTRTQPPVARPTQPPPPGGPASAGSRPPAPPVPVAEPTVVPPEPVRDDNIASGSLDDLNRNSPLRPAFFAYNSSDVEPEAQAVLDSNATVLRSNRNWTVTIEGHCDERGSAEYNLSLGERRAMSARAYLVSLGIPADRIRIVSYGKEFPFDPGKDEAAYAKNRRAHFVITAK